MTQLLTRGLRGASNCEGKRKDWRLHWKVNKESSHISYHKHRNTKMRKLHAEPPARGSRTLHPRQEGKGKSPGKGWWENPMEASGESDGAAKEKKGKRSTLQLLKTRHQNKRKEEGTGGVEKKGRIRVRSNSTQDVTKTTQTRRTGENPQKNTEY